MEYLKNPIIAGILTSGISFLYLKWVEQKARQDDPLTDVEPADMKLPIILGIIVFLTLSIWNNYKLPITNQPSVKIPMDIASSPFLPIKNNVIGKSMIGNALPNIFIETV